MTWLISTALRLRVLVLALAALVSVAGVRRADDIPLDVFPEFAPPMVEIQTPCLGLSPAEVEGLEAEVGELRGQLEQQGELESRVDGLEEEVSGLGGIDDELCELDDIFC